MEVGARFWKVNFMKRGLSELPEGRGFFKYG